MNQEEANQMRQEMEQLREQLRILELKRTEEKEKRTEEPVPSASSTNSIKPPKMEKEDDLLNYCDRFKAYIKMTGSQPNMDLLFLQNVSSATYRTLKTVAASFTEEQKQDVDFICKQFLSTMYGDEIIYLKSSLLETKQKSGETIAEYCKRLQELASIAYSCPEQGQEACLLALFRGISNSRVKQKLNESLVTSFPEAVRLAKRLEQVNIMFGDKPSTSRVMKVTYSDIETETDTDTDTDSDYSYDSRNQSKCYRNYRK